MAATLDKIRETIRDIAERPKNISESEIKWVVDQLKEHGFNVRKPRKTRHGQLYGINSVRFQICTHHPGGKQIKRCYVEDFLNAMTELGLYED